MNYALHRFCVKQQYVSYPVVGKSMKTLGMLSLKSPTTLEIIGRLYYFLALDAQAQK